MNFEVLADWRTEVGYRAVVTQGTGNYLRHLCGYVGIEYGHLLHKKDHHDLNVHGGVTFAAGGKNSEHPIKSNLWWIGFDCAHLDDTPEKCNLDYCKRECESLAAQIKESNHAPAQKV